MKKAAGYSKTPLIKKLGIKAGYKVRIVHPPDHYMELLGEIPPDVVFLKRKGKDIDFIHLFAKNIHEMENQLVLLKDEIKKSGMIWVSWYKKSSKIPTDLNEDMIRNTAISLGLVDIKVCAIDEQWSGLKVVWRKENR